MLNCSERKRVWCLDILGDFASWTFSAVKIGDIVDVMLVRENLLQITDVPHAIHVNYDPATVSAVSTEAEYVCLVEVKEIYERESNKLQ